MESINVEHLTPEQVSQITSRKDFNKIFAAMTPEHKKILMEKMKEASAQKQKSNKNTNILKVEKKQTPSVPKNTKKTNTIIKKNGELIQEPSLMQKAKSLAKGLGEWAKSGFKFASTEDYNARMVICRKCEFWKEIPGPMIGKCRKCGCSGAKQKLATSVCPINKWGRTTAVK